MEVKIQGQHPDDAVRLALVRLNDALCQRERGTGRQSVLILREQGGVVCRSVNGKPVVGCPDYELSDELLVAAALQE